MEFLSLRHGTDEPTWARDMLRPLEEYMATGGPPSEMSFTSNCEVTSMSLSDTPVSPSVFKMAVTGAGSVTDGPHALDGVVKE